MKLKSHILISTCFVFLVAAEIPGARGKDAEMPIIQCDILIVGGGLGGVAAALQACNMATEFGIQRIVLTEETDWLGGQYTSQGVTASDPNEILAKGNYYASASKLYYDFHETIRGFYRSRALETARETTRTGNWNSRARQMEIEYIEGPTFSPGNPWGSRMSSLPEDGVRAIDLMLEPFLGSRLLSVHYNKTPVEVLKKGNQVTGVILRDTKTNEELMFRAAFTLDATELGDLLPLSGAGYRVGIEASTETSEPSLFDENWIPLYPEPRPDCTQSFTYTFALEWRPSGEDHRLPWETCPESYWQNRHRYSTGDEGRWFMMTRSNEFRASQDQGRLPPWWTYRRMVDAMFVDPGLNPDLHTRFVDGKWKTDFDPESTPEYFIPHDGQTNVGDIIQVNWQSNDFTGESIIDVSAEEREAVLWRAKELSLGYLYYLWYEAPRDPKDPRVDPSQENNWSLDPATGKNRGYANLKFRPDVMDTEDGLSKFPYIRESRRLRALFTVRQQDLMGQIHKRARLFQDTLGIGHYYYMDIHRCDFGCEEKRDVDFRDMPFEDGTTGWGGSTRRFQIPLGTLIPEQTDSLLAAAKNIGLTRLAAAAYRLHPVEFHIGQAAGAVAALSLYWHCQPREIWEATPSFKPTQAERRLRHLQHELLKARVPLFWNEDCGWDTEDFLPVQWVCLLGILDARERVFEPQAPLTRAEAVKAVFRLARAACPKMADPGRFSDLPRNDAELIAAVNYLETQDTLDWLDGEEFEPDVAVTKAQLQHMLSRVFADTKQPLQAKEERALSRGDAAREMFGEIARRFDLSI